jgi:hypothetical protein
LETRELDHVIAAVFGLWDHIIPDSRLFSKGPQLPLPLAGPKKAGAARVMRRKTADDE